MEMWCKSLFFVALLVCATVDAARIKNHYTGKQALKFLKSHQRISNHVRRNATTNTGLWPSVFNLATKAVISVNATCGETGREEFCRMVENGKGRCGICDNFSPDPGKRHAIKYAIDGSNKWWQSPALYYGPDYEYVTITIDLKQIYQIAYIIIKAANSPRPGTWILERSVDGKSFDPWQYYARNDKECLERFGVPATKGKPHYFTDSEVICTSFYSRFTPTENGEIHTSLVHGRPGANESSPELLEFTKARYVRIRMMGLRGTQEPVPRWFTQDIWRDKRLFYSIRDISIGGQCVCNGHAENCRHNVASGHPECECSHHTCGSNCDKCCPMYNQRQWAPGTSRDGHRCLPCNCNGHATSCHYDQNVDKSGLSMDIHGNYQGGGVCDNCTSHTTGVNCELCTAGFYRPDGVSADVLEPCLRCDCDPVGSTGVCVQHGVAAGTCECEPGYAGERCDRCHAGFRGYPACEACPCDPKGTRDMKDCEGDCECKVNVEGKFCDRCKSGYFGLNETNAEGCSSCFCSGVTTLCESAIIKPQKIQVLKDWLITDLKATHFIKPVFSEQTIFSVGNYELPGIESLYWLAPEDYLGNKLEAYNANLRFKVQWVVMRGDTSGEATFGPNAILVGENDEQIAYGDDIFYSNSMSFNIKLNESGWYHLPSKIMDITTRMKKNLYKGPPVTRNEFLAILKSIKRVLLRSSFHTDQIEALLEEASLSIGEDVDKYGFGGVEKCSCSSGYTGLSCEKCSFGYVRIFANDSDGVEQGFCGKCDCNGHSETCNANTGECFCQHNTIGEKCERCAAGYYGNPLHGTPDDCKKCACPLENEDNNFSPSCQLDYFAENEEESNNYVCTQCPKGYTGDHCEICDDGYYGNPMETGNRCQACECNGGPCDRRTGQCLSCKGNTEGWKCEKCKPDHYGDPLTSNCKDCECDPIGSILKQCDNVTGQCQCKEKFIGRTCDKCESGYGNVTGLCLPCDCNPTGSKSEICDPHTGICECQAGVDGFHCDTCQNMYYGFSEDGCKPCDCDAEGSISQNCDETGNCLCQPNFIGRKCDKCKNEYWHNRGFGCKKCNCNLNGAISNNCDPNTGQCPCKAGITGQFCDKCMKGYYGSVLTECKKCDPCNKPGHVCDPKNGKCVCPPLSTGAKCDECVKNAWGFEPGFGCKQCECSKGGSIPPCDVLSGQCTCKIGYQGAQCNNCTSGFHPDVYHNCVECSCSPIGSQCSNNICECSSVGDCKCKPLVDGSKCNKCKESTFGLSKDKEKGCTECFCFGRSSKCEDSNYNWDKIRTSKIEKDTFQCISRAPCFPLLPQFLGDLTASYGGYITVQSSGPFKVFIKNSKGIIIENFSETKKEIKLEEYQWKLTTKDSVLPPNCIDRLSRNCLMVVLQDVTSITIEALHHQTDISEVLLDKSKAALPISHQKYHTVEKCRCPSEYTGLSCQDPSPGYYRSFPTTPPASYIDQIVGVATKCDCNGKSEECDPITGHCKNCRDNTFGDHCEKCAQGHYMDPLTGICKPCLCPSATVNNAIGCDVTNKEFICHCKPGYKQPSCIECDTGFYRHGTECLPCNCNEKTTTSTQCDPNTGDCQCKQGFSGPKCSACDHPREYVKNGQCTPCDECTQLLFQQLDDIVYGFDETLDKFKDGIGPPWDELTKTLQKHDLLSDKYEIMMNKVDSLIKNADLEKLEDSVDYIDSFVTGLQQEKAEDVVNKLDEHSKRLQKEIVALQDKLLKIINDLNISNTKQIDVNEALKEGELTLKSINDIAKQFAKNKYEKQLKKCNDISREIEKIYNDTNINPDKLQKLLQKLLEQLNDLSKLNSEVQRTTDIAKSKNNSNRKRLDDLMVKINTLQENNKLTQSNINDIMEKVNAAAVLSEQVKNVYESLKTLKTNELFTRLRKRQISKDTDNLDYIMDSVDDHIDDLDITLNAYRSLFNFTNEEWKKINASVAYEEIVNQIRSFNATAKDAFKKIQETIQILDPKYNDSIQDLAVLSQAYSDRLKKRIENLKDLKPEYNRVKNDVDNLKYNILNNGKRNNDLNKILNEMGNEVSNQSDRVSKLEKTISDNENVSDHMQRVLNEVNNMNLTSQYDLFKDYKKYLNLTSKEEIDRFKIRFNLTDVDSNYSLFDYVKNIKVNKYHIKNYKNDFDVITSKLDLLTNRIKESRNIANSLKIYLNLTDCVRTYDPPAEAFEKFSFIFKCGTCSPVKLYIGNAGSPSEVLKFSVKDNSTEIILGRKSLKKFPPMEGYITVKLYKFGVRLKVIVINETSSDTGLFLPGEVKGEDSVTKIEVGDRSNKDGTIYSMKYNRETIGLWNYNSTTNESCNGVSELFQAKGQTEDQIYWDGRGYGIYTENGIKGKEISLAFKFKTFDENSLLYLTHNEECKYIALFLKNGKINMKISNTKEILMELPKKMNDGSSKVVTIRNLYDSDTKLQTIKLEDDSGLANITTIQLKASELYKIKLAKQLLAGVDPTFKQCKGMNIETRSFLGMLKEQSNRIKEQQSYGMSKNEEFKFTKVWLNDKGHLTLSYPEESFKNISFLLRPHQNFSSGFIMNIAGMVRLYMENKKLKLETKTEKLTLSEELQIDEYNYIELSLVDGIVTLNNKHKTFKFENDGKSKGLQIIFGDDREPRTYIGGFYQLILDGNRMLYFDQKSIQNFHRADIGRELPKTRNVKTEKPKGRNHNHTTYRMQNTESCSSIKGDTPQKGVVKFGDKSNSNVKIENVLMKKNFAISFEFRTFYRNGMLLFAEGNKGHYFVLELREGKVHFKVKGRKEKEVNIPVQVNDGEWHMVTLSQTLSMKNRKVTIILDKTNNKMLKIPKINAKNVIYLGGVPKNYRHPNVALLPFRGCVKHFILDGNQLDLANNKISENIGQCYPKVETGAYFSGDSYAVYKEYFQVTNVLDLRFEFRTADQNGILLSVSNPGNSPALSIELQNGAVVMSIDMGNGKPNNVSNNLNSDFALCNNKWHNVTASYSNSELTINVDGIMKTWVQSEANSITEEINAPLYIGGIKYGASGGTLKIRENFKGCIRNIQIGDDITDWTDMAELNNVALNSCPVDK